MLIPVCQLLASIFGQYLRKWYRLGGNEIRPLSANLFSWPLCGFATSMNYFSALIEELSYCLEEPQTGFLDEQEMT